MSTKADCKLQLDIQLLEAKLSELEFEKVKVEDQCRLLKKRNEELEEEIKKIGNDKIVGCNEWKGKGDMVDLFGGEEDEIFQLMIVNKVLECEKRKAESEVEEWKAKFMELQSRLDELEKSFASELKKCVSSGMKDIDQGLYEMGETNGKVNSMQGSLRSANLQVENMERKEDESGSVGTGNCNSSIEKAATKGVEETGGTPSARTPLEEFTYGDRGKRSTPLKYEIQDKFRVRKRLAFLEDESPSKKMAPSTPSGVRHVAVDVIDIDDSDDEKNTTLDHSAPPTVLIGQCDHGCCEGNLSFKPNLRRKLSCNVVTSDAESDDSDNTPLSKLTKIGNKEKDALDEMGKYGTGSVDSGDEVGEPVERPRLRRLRKCKEIKYNLKGSPSPRSKNCTGRNYNIGIPTDVIATDDDNEDSSHSEGDSLDGFIVNSSNLSDREETCDGVEATQRDSSSSSENYCHSEDASDSDENLDYKEIISQIQRSRNHKTKWEFEADMLADFGKNPELCMRAVCALYRQQTSEERIVKGTFVSNGRGFNQCDAFRGSELAEFLMKEQDDLQKSVEELLEHDPKGPEKCRELASRYSKQLFEIYLNQEDPFFLPSREGQ